MSPFSPLRVRRPARLGRPLSGWGSPAGSGSADSDGAGTEGSITISSGSSGSGATISGTGAGTEPSGTELGGAVAPCPSSSTRRRASLEFPGLSGYFSRKARYSSRVSLFLTCSKIKPSTFSICRAIFPRACSGDSVKIRFRPTIMSSYSLFSSRIETRTFSAPSKTRLIFADPGFRTRARSN